ncbi:DUF6207 family protein [Streptomyces sp. NPDC048643]|uniref:DUF6207 family protein n=1 Tax=Streptomyces sp. NPDC048643 TaxID=3155637 RepID=UPI0034124A08
MAQGLPALAAEQEAQGRDAGPRAGARRGLIPGIGSGLSAVPAAPPVRRDPLRKLGAIAAADRTTRDPGQPVVRLRCADSPAVIISAVCRTVAIPTRPSIGNASARTFQAAEVGFFPVPPP